MEIKEAIEWLEVEKQMSYNDRTQKCTREVIALLQQGEAYRLILKALDKKYGHYLIGVKDNGEVGVGYTIRDLIDISYQKYFPKNKETNEKG